ncbi:MAG: hypothetical protein IJE91_01680 [Clostridia bacterium]|nr:hypothetical protein [Clostridia bacterium]
MAKKKLELFRVLYTEANENLIDEIYDYYSSQQPVPSSLKTRLTMATDGVNLEKLKQVAQNGISEEHLMYVGMCDGKIVSTFTHMYKPVSNEMYLYECNTHDSMQGQGLGTKFYKEIAEDIFNNFEVLDICADAITAAGRKLLEKLEFLPNTKPFSYGGNAILYSPNIEHPKLYIRLETLMDVCPTRDFTNSPNVDRYNQMLKALIYSHTYVEADALQFFKCVHVAYMKATAQKALKKAPTAPLAVPVPPATMQEFNFGGQVFKFNLSPSLDMGAPCMEDYDPTEGEIAENLKKLEQVKNLQRK